MESNTGCSQANREISDDGISRVYRPMQNSKKSLVQKYICESTIQIDAKETECVRNDIMCLYDSVSY